MFLSRLSKRERYLFYVSIAIIVGVFFDKIVFKPIMNKLEQLNNEILIQEKRLDKSTRVLQQGDSITKEYEKYAKYIKQRNSDEEATAIMLSDIEKIAKKCAVSLLDIKPSPAEKSEFYKKYSVKIEAEAKINQLTDFIFQLEKSSQLFRVGEFRLSPKTEGSEVLKIYIVVSEILII